MFRVIRVILLVTAASLILSPIAQAGYIFELETTDSSVVVGAGFIDLPIAGGNLANVGDVVFSFSGSGFSWTDSDITALVWSQADADLVLSLTAETNSLCGPGSDCENRILDLHVNDGSSSGVAGGYQCRVGALLCDSIFINAGAVTTATRVPEPTTFALLGLGLACVGYGRRKQIKAA